MDLITVVDRLSNMEGKLDQILLNFDRFERRLDSHSRRIAVIEKWKWKMIGAVAACVSLATAWLGWRQHG